MWFEKNANVIEHFFSVPSYFMEDLTFEKYQEAISKPGINFKDRVGRIGIFY